MDEENRRPTWLEGEEERPDRSEKPRVGEEPPKPSERPAPRGEPPHLERGSPRPTRVRPDEPDPAEEE